MARADRLLTLSVTFMPTNTDHYTTGTTSVLINVLKATPVITWANPADIVYGTALGAAQLNATANTPGTFVYTAAPGTVLNGRLRSRWDVALSRPVGRHGVRTLHSRRTGIHADSAEIIDGSL